MNEGSTIRDLEVADLVKNGNMEQLAALVLNGEGRRLIGRQSGNAELQAFIDNVPSYMVRNVTFLFHVDNSFGATCNASA